MNRFTTRKNWLSIVFCTICLLVLLPQQIHAIDQPMITTSAQAAALIDVASGRIIYQHNGDQSLPIASLTKIMTAIVAIEHGNLADQVTVGPLAFGKEGSSIYLKLQEEMNLHHMLYGLMLRSGNDAATAIAEHIGGSIEGFTYLMNQKAEELGMVNSSYKNPHGLDEKGHFSSANDMAKLTAYALKNPIFQDIVKTKVKSVPNNDEKWDHLWFNKNKMLSLYPGADGVKTGYTKIAHRCLISSASRNGQQFVAVTINDGNDWEDHRRLLDFGFQYYPLNTLARKGEPVQITTDDSKSLVIGASLTYPLTTEESADIKRVYRPIAPDTVTYRLGVLARVEWYLGERLVGSVPVYESTNPLLQQTLKGGSAFTFRSSPAYEQKLTWISSLKNVLHAMFRL